MQTPEVYRIFVGKWRGEICRTGTVYLSMMSNVTQILTRMEQGDSMAAAQLLPLVYEELRTLAARKLEREKPAQPFQATELVHEAYLRLVDVAHQQQWDSRGHFFAAAAEAMRRILVEQARRRQSLKHGGGHKRQPWDETAIAIPTDDTDMLALDEALARLETVDKEAAELVKLRYFSGLTIAQVAELRGQSMRTTERLWAFAKAWLYREMQPG
ncbi:MAG: sigma-70 family RNA polymerase sigma factor [Pirellulaceae bacterium]